MRRSRLTWRNSFFTTAPRFMRVSRRCEGRRPRGWAGSARTRRSRTPRRRASGGRPRRRPRREGFRRRARPKGRRPEARTAGSDPAGSAALTSYSVRSESSAFNPAGVSSAAIRPSAMKAIRRQYSASSRKWVVTKTVVPAAEKESMRSQKARRWTGSTPAVGSSRKTTAGSWTMAQAKARRCWYPRGNSPARTPADSERASRENSSSRRFFRRPSGSP